jgi:DNA-binding NarL/FixJ family response regulator
MLSQMPYVIILDDHPLVGRGMAQYLQTIHLELTVHVATGWAQVREHIQASGCPQVLVADVWLADSNSLATLTKWRVDCPNTPWLAISGDADPLMQERVRSAGAQGFVHKQASPEVFGLAFTAVLTGGQWFELSTETYGHQPREWVITPEELSLTPRQGEILALVLRGLPNKRIALLLSLSESTVKEHLTRIFERLGVKSRVEILTHLRGRQLVLQSQS